MQRPENKHVISLLVKVYNCTVMDFYYFPDIVLAGGQKLERAEFDLLQAEGYIHIHKFDSFGRYYMHTKKCETVLYQQLAARQQRRRKPSVPLNQGCLYFSRYKNPQASGSRCLLFF